MSRRLSRASCASRRRALELFFGTYIVSPPSATTMVASALPHRPPPAVAYGGAGTTPDGGTQTLILVRCRTVFGNHSKRLIDSSEEIRSPLLPCRFASVHRWAFRARALDSAPVGRSSAVELTSPGSHRRRKGRCPCDTARRAATRG